LSRWRGEPKNNAGVDAEEIFMPYALFTNGEQISKAYRSREEVWKKAEEAGLIVDLPSEEESKKPKQVLDEGYHIQTCQPDQAADVPAAASNAESEPALRKRSSSGR
jgi:hypothetical protein